MLEFNEQINYEYRIMILEKIIARLTEDNPDLLQPHVIDAVVDEALIEMQAKYPGADIKIKEDENNDTVKEPDSKEGLYDAFFEKTKSYLKESET